MPDQAPSAAPIYVVAAHPDLEHSRVTAALLKAALDVQGVAICDLYARYPDFHIDVMAEQRRLEQAGALVWLHPLHWYGMPALLKLWLDEVMRHGWAYGSRTPDGQPTQALRGKSLWLATSAGGPREAYSATGYNQYPLDVFLAPYRQTAALCGLRWRPPLVVYGAHRVSDEELGLHVQHWTDGLRQLVASGGLASDTVDAASGLPAAVPTTDRPVT